jgi:DNA-binding response OmpR family regulator
MPDKKIHLLMIDDDPAILRLFGAQLADAGFEVMPAHDGNEGREVARRFLPDLILCDQKMPIMDGMEVISRLKAEDITKNIPVILFTNEDFSVEAERLVKESGAADYIHKSTPIAEIVERINKVLAAKPAA